MNERIGWTKIKRKVEELIKLSDQNYNRELEGLSQLPVAMHRLFLGNPGTGKTTCAGIYGRILKELGFLRIGEVVCKSSSDFMGEYIGQSTQNTVRILKEAQGKVLLIDEAYALDDANYGKQVGLVLVVVICLTF